MRPPRGFWWNVVGNLLAVLVVAVLAVYWRRAR